MAYEIIMPVLGMSQDTGVIASWCKSPGDYVNVGDVIFEVETDKAVQEIESTESGYLSKVLYKENEKVPVGQVIGLIVSELPENFDATNAVSSASDVSDGEQQQTDHNDAQSELDNGDNVDENVIRHESAQNLSQKDRSKTVVHNAGDKVLASASARLIAHQNQLKLSDVFAKINKTPLHSEDVTAYLDIIANENIQTPNQSQMQSFSPVSPKLAFRVDHTGIKECENWLSTKQRDNQDLTAAHLMATLASSLWRKLVVDDESVTISASVQCVTSDGFQSTTLLDADLQRFSRLSCDQNDTDLMTDFTLIDLRDSILCEYEPGVCEQPTIVVAKKKKQIKISLYGMSVTKNIAALQFMDTLARQLEEPLLYIV